MNGFEFVKKVREIVPPVKVILMSAFDINDPVYMSLSSSLNIDGFIQKPFSLKEVIFTIIKQLDKWNQTKITFIHFNLYSSLWCRSVDTGWKLTSDIKFVQLGFNPAILNTSKIDFSGIPTKCLILLRRSSWIAAITFPSFTNTAPLSWPSFIPRTMCYF